MAAADARGLHRARGREVGRPERYAVHARRGGRDRLDVLDALGGLQDRVDQDRPGHLVARLELREELVEIVDVPRPLDLGQHHHVELVAGGRHDLRDVVERPRRVECIDPGPQPGRAEVVRARHLDEARARRLLGVGGNRVLQVAEHHVDLADQVGTLARIFSTCGGTKWIMRSSRTGSSW